MNFQQSQFHLNYLLVWERLDQETLKLVDGYCGHEFKADVALFQDKVTFKSMALISCGQTQISRKSFYKGGKLYRVFGELNANNFKIVDQRSWSKTLTLFCMNFNVVGLNVPACE